MTTEEIIIHIFCTVDDEMSEVEEVPQADLYPSVVVTIGILVALKGGRFRAFCRWLKRDYDALFGGLPDRTTLQRQLRAQQVHANKRLGDPALLNVIDSFPIELLFPLNCCSQSGLDAPNNKLASRTATKGAGRLASSCAGF